MKKLTPCLLLILGLNTSIAFGQSTIDSSVVPVYSFKLDWLFKRNADADRSESELKICDSAYAKKAQEAIKLRQANSFKDSALSAKQMIRANDSTQINTLLAEGDLLQKKIHSQQNKIKRRNFIIIAESVFIGTVVLVVYLLNK